VTKQSRPFVTYALPTEITTNLLWFRQALLTWFDVQGRSFPWRKPRRSSYEILVAEILLQRTTAAKVAQAYNAFLVRYPSWSELAHTASEDLEEHLKPLVQARGSNAGA
jgi:A/G-specific adenine glycosylase